jgi:hypothetical protein
VVAAKADLLREALTRHTRSLAAPDTGSWESDVREFAATLAAFFGDPVEVSQNALMATGSHPDYTAAVLEHYAAIFDDWRAMLARARDRGEVAPTSTPTPSCSRWCPRSWSCRCCSAAGSRRTRSTRSWIWSSG